VAARRVLAPQPAAAAIGCLPLQLANPTLPPAGISEGLGTATAAATAAVRVPVTGAEVLLPGSVALPGGLVAAWLTCVAGWRLSSNPDSKPHDGASGSLFTFSKAVGQGRGISRRQLANDERLPRSQV
jgi:hypothetical protein